MTVQVFDFTSGKSFSITAADHSSPYTIGIAGNQVFKFKTGDTVTIAGSTANDGDYTIASTPTYSSPTTTIVLTEALTDSTADGTVSSAHEDYGVPSDFVGERALYTAAGVEIEKKSYQDYLESSTTIFAMLRNRFYLAGSDTVYKFLYSAKGDTLTDDTDESEVLNHYSDIIKQWTIYKFLIWYGDDASAAREEGLLKLDLDLLKKNESRISKYGRPVRISAYNRT